MHKQYFKMFNPVEEGRHLVIQAARGSAKTTLICLIDVMHRICYSTESYILMLSSTRPLAISKTQDIFNEILNNETLRAFYDLEFVNKRSSKEQFIIKSRYGICLVKSQGFFSQIRGTKFNAERPSRIICDDVTHGTRVFSEAQREKEKRQYDTDIKQAAQPKTNHIMVGTPLHHDDLITSKYADNTWETMKYKAILKWPKNMNLWQKWEDIFKNPKLTKTERKKAAEKFYRNNKKKMEEGAKLLWPERENLWYLMLERLRIGRRAFNAEKQLYPFLTGEALFRHIQWFNYRFEEKTGKMFFVFDDGTEVERKPATFHSYYALDPASGERKKINSSTPLSQSARVWGWLDLETDNFYLDGCEMDRLPQTKIIDEMYSLHQTLDFKKMAFEENLYRDLYYEVIKERGAEYNKKNKTNVKLPITSVYATIQKEHRIYSLEPLITNGKIKFYKYLQPEFIAQLQDYPNCDRNDGLDALEILMKISNPKHKISTIPLYKYR